MSTTKIAQDNPNAKVAAKEQAAAARGNRRRAIAGKHLRAAARALDKVSLSDPAGCAQLATVSAIGGALRVLADPSEATLPLQRRLLSAPKESATREDVAQLYPTQAELRGPQDEKSRLRRAVLATARENAAKVRKALADLASHLADPMPLRDDEVADLCLHALGFVNLLEDNIEQAQVEA